MKCESQSNGQKAKFSLFIRLHFLLEIRSANPASNIIHASCSGSEEGKSGRMLTDQVTEISLKY